MTTPARYFPKCIGAWHPSWDDDGNGGATLNDLSVYENHGTITGATWTADTDSGGVRALSFDGVDDYVAVSSGPVVEAGSSFSVAMWCIASSGFGYFFSWYVSSGQSFLIRANGSSNLEVVVNNNQITLTTTSVSSWTHIAVTFDGTNWTVYADGVSIGTGTQSFTSGMDPSSAPYELGARESTTWPLEGKIDAAYIFSEALTASEILALSSSRTFQPQSALQSFGPSLIAGYSPSLDDTGNGTLYLHDLSGGMQCGAINGATWTADTDNGGVRALSFSAGNDVDTGISVEDTRPYTVSCWYKSSSTTNYQILAATLTGSNGFRFNAYAFGAVNFTVHDGAWKSATKSYTPDGNWHHFAAVYDGSQITAYYDGVAGTPTAVGTLTAGGGNLRIGEDAGGGNSNLDGPVDSALFFNEALTAGQITALASSRTYRPTLQGLPGQELWFPFSKDSKGRGTTTCYDYTGVSSGTLSNAAMWQSDGTISFNGTEKITVSSKTLTGEKSVTFWIKMASGDSGVILGGVSTVYYPYIDATNIYVRNTGSSTFFNHGGLDDGSWHHVAVVGNGTTVEFFKDGVSLGSGTDRDGTTLTTIGDYSNASDPLTGSINDLRVFDRALSPAEIKFLATPQIPAALPDQVAWYVPTRDAAGRGTTTLTDHSGSADGTLSGGYIWEDESIKFDGVDGKLAATDDGNASTSISFWAKIPASPSNGIILISGLDWYSSSAWHWGIFHYNSVFSFATGGLNTAFSPNNDDTWHHYTFIRDDGAGNSVVYEDGVQLTTGTGSLTAKTTGSLVAGDIGGSTPFAYELNDIRLNTRVLTPAEIATLAFRPTVNEPSYNALIGLGSHLRDGYTEGHWNLDDSAASTVVTNEVASDSTLVGGLNTNQVRVIGSSQWDQWAFDFDGTADCINPTSAFEVAGTAWTLIFNINMDAWTFRILDSNDGGGRQILQVSSSGYPEIYDGGWHTTSTVLQKSLWHHLAVTAEAQTGDDAFFYVDGLFFDSVACAVVALGGGTNTAIASHYLRNTAFADGRISLGLAYDRILANPEILALYIGPAPLHLTVPVLTISTTTWSATLPTVDQQNNGPPITYWELRNSSDQMVESGWGTASGTGTYSGDYYLYVRTWGNGGADPLEDMASATVTATAEAGAITQGEINQSAILTSTLQGRTRGTAAGNGAMIKELLNVGKASGRVR